MKLAVVWYNKRGDDWPGPKRRYGQFSYAVPEFEWDPIPRHKHWELDTKELAVDAIWQEDNKCHGEFIRTDDTPVIYWVLDTNISYSAYKQRCAEGSKRDLILVDNDRLDRFEHLGVPVRRFPFCVNDRIFKDYGLERKWDVGFYCSPTYVTRAQLRIELQEFCKRRGYSFHYELGDIETYARNMNQTRICVNLHKVIWMRNHRVFDTMACRSCLLTDPVPEMEERRVAGKHYVEWAGYDDLTRTIDRLLETGDWEYHADQGYGLVQKYHTWAIRAGELQQMLAEELGR
jgi:spore maturation protein CgeB